MCTALWRPLTTCNLSLSWAAKMHHVGSLREQMPSGSLSRILRNQEDSKCSHPPPLPESHEPSQSESSAAVLRF